MNEQEKFYEAGRKLDPLFGHLDRDFQPTIEQVIEMISIQGEPYDPPNGRQRVNFSLRPDLITDVQAIAAQHDMSASAMVDVLLRVALGDWHEWWVHNEGHFTAADEADQEEK